MGLLREEKTLSIGRPAAALVDALRAKVKPGPLLAFEGDDPNQPLRGTVGEAGFEVVRRAITRNSFTPVVKGELREADGLTTVRLSLAPHRLMLGAVLAPAVFCTGMALYLAVGLGLPFEVVAVSVGLAVAGPAVAVLAFKAAVTDTFELLQRILMS